VQLETLMGDVARQLGHSPMQELEGLEKQIAEVPLVGDCDPFALGLALLGKGVAQIAPDDLISVPKQTKNHEMQGIREPVDHGERKRSEQTENGLEREPEKPE